ncbi:MAG: hypothetical protein CMJ53_01015 [Planctomycetaceae bacterium]|nr:hypothetical protein [Planctomycetaceae bacterium]
MSKKKHLTIVLLIPFLEGMNAFAETLCDAEAYGLRHAWCMPAEQDRDDERRFGSSGVLVHDGLIAIATDHGPDGSLNSGKVRLYDREDPEAVPPSILMAPKRSWPDGFGFALRGFEHHILIGAPDDSDTNWGAGRAWLYLETEDGWVVERSFEDPSSETDAAFGHAIAIQKDTIAIGAPRSDKAGRDAGCVFIFERVEQEWTLKARLVAPDAENADFFGSSLALKGNHLAIGAWGDDDHGEKTGAVWCYEKRGDRWSMRQKLVPDRLQSRDLFGSALLFHEHELLISAPGTREDQGVVYVFTGRTGRWELVDRISDPSGDAGDRFGSSLSASEGLLVIGSPEHRAKMRSDGMITLHRRSHWGWSLIDRHRVTSQHGEQSMRFGFNVSVDQGVIVVGRADQEDEPSASIGAWLFDEGVDITEEASEGVAINSR